ncbi:cell division protein ZapA [Intestinibacter sp.]
MNKVIVTIQGANYTMVGEKSEKEMLTIANYVNSEMEKLRESAPNLGSLKVSILTSLNLADLLFECSGENETLLAEVEELRQQLSQPNDEVEAKVTELENALKTKEIELANSNKEIERLNNIVCEQSTQIDGLSNVTEGSKSEIEDYKEQIESLKKSLDEMRERAEIAEGLSSEWQNKSFNLQLAITDLENKIKETSNEVAISENN